MTTIPYSEALHLRHICSDDEWYLAHTQELEQYLVDRGYRDTEMQRQIDQATSRDRTELLSNHSEKTNLGRVPLVVTHHPHLPPLSYILRRHLPILHASEKMRKAAPHPPLVVNRRPRNLKDLLVRAT